MDTLPDTRVPARVAFEAQQIQTWLTARLAGLLRVDISDVDPTQPFAEHGVGSREALELSGALEEWLDVRLPATLAWDYPTIELLAEHLAKRYRAPSHGSASGSR
ncbi:MAG: acyl carrier protein [Chloroflexi bacterium]|nr:acyl carrier protein [Chloroflexota bacterium]